MFKNQVEVLGSQPIFKFIGCVIMYGIRERMCGNMKPSGVGGQAVIEGVMMKNKDVYATAVRKPDKEIVIEKGTYVSVAEKIKLFKFPIFRGMLSFAESMIIGTKTLTFSSSFYEEEEATRENKSESAFNKIFKGKAEAVATGITFFISILLAVGIFIILPRFIANLLEKRLDSEVILAIIEGFIRILIFITYVLAISQVKDIKRMFMYHGAEHKTINCIENGFELTVDNVRKQSKQHKRCGTSFLFIVMFVSIVFFIFIRVDQEWLRYAIRVLLIPLIAGVSYEFIRYAGRSNSVLANILSKPGLWMQGLTTREPDDDMIEVAIQSVEAVFDWRGFLELDKNTGKATKSRNSSNRKNTGKKSSNKNSTVGGEKVTNGNASKSRAGKNSSNTDTESSRQSASESKEQKRNQTVAPEIQAASEDKVKSGKSQRKGSGKKSADNSYQKASEEIAAAVENIPEAKPRNIFDEEEDDEILRALDRYLNDKEDGRDEE